MKDILIITLLLFCCGCAAEEPLNVVVLFTDDQRFNTINALGHADVYTPNLDRLVERGVSFTRAHVMGSHHGAVCAPSRAMLLSGRPMHDLPLDYIDRGRADYRRDFDFLTFPEYFRARGYETFFTGKWHNHTSKLRTGFERAENVFIGGMHWPRDGGHASPWLWHQDTTGRYANEDRWRGEGFSSQLFTDAALDFLDTRRSDRPFCMYVAYSSPHDPRMAPAEYVAHYAEAEIPLPPNFLPQHPFDNGNLRIRDELLLPFPRGADSVRNEIKGYYAMISEVDAQIGRILDDLEARDLLDRTIIVFAGDNGLAVGQHGLLGKQNLYDHSVRVPLIIAAPQFAGDRRATTLAYLHDVFPTLRELTGDTLPPGLGGRSLLPALQDEAVAVRDTVYLHHARQMRAIRTADDHKLILTFAGGQTHTQLYAIGEDAYETRNLADEAAYQPIKEQLLRQLTDYLVATEDRFFTPAIDSRLSAASGPPEVRITHPAGLTELRYTRDGSTPRASSPRYTGPFPLREDATIQAAAFYQGKRVGEPVTETIRQPRRVRSITWSAAPADKYAASGPTTLLDGQRGSASFTAGRWLGYEGRDVEITVELPDEEPVNRVGLGYLHRPGDWIFPPKTITVSLSTDGTNYVTVAVDHPARPERGAATAELFTAELPDGPRRARFAKFRVTGIGQCPAGHPGAGQPAWLFLDELIID